MANSVSFPFSWAAQPGAWGPSSLLGAGFLYHILFPSWSGLQNWLNFQCTQLYNSSTPTPLEWHVFDRHRSKINVMQFTGHPLLVHQFVTVPWDFTLSHIFSQARPRQRNMLFRRLWNGMFGRVGSQYTTRSPRLLVFLSILFMLWCRWS